MSIFKDKVILVTGGTGSIGSELVRKLLKHDPKVIRVFSNDENGQHELMTELQEHKDKLRHLIGDVRDKHRVKRAMEGVNIVFHSAAMKHVPLCEYNPFEAINTNVIGTRNVIEAALENDSVEKFINISTDKAASPVSTMGATKLLTEKLTTWATFYKFDKKPVFASVRFGNVMSSRGSVIPLFLKQIKNGGPVTVTDENMTRFMMSIPDAVKLVLHAAEVAEGGETFVLKMPALRIKDLAQALIEEKRKTVDIKMIGTRPGEKVYEYLMSEDEIEYAKDIGDMYIIPPSLQLPYLDNVEKGKIDKNLLCSKTAKLLTKDEIKMLLKSIDIV